MATQVPRLTLEELVERSERIVRGQCVRSWTAWDAERRFIWTHTEITVLEGWKGAAARTLVVSEPGGIVDGVGMAIEGVPQHRAGEEAVLFLYRTPIGYWRARGLGQGKFLVRGDRVWGGPGEAAVIDPAGAVAAGTSLRLLDGASLEDLRTRVRGLLLRPPAGVR